MKRIVASFALLILLPTGCKQDDLPPLKLIDLGTFRLETPDTWKDVPGVGYDSQVGQLTNGSDVLAYDYGWYSYRLQNETSATHLRTVTTIDGRPALIARPKKRGQGTIGLFVEVDDLNRLSLTGRDSRDEATIIRIFQSVKF